MMMFFDWISNSAENSYKYDACILIKGECAAAKKECSKLVLDSLDTIEVPKMKFDVIISNTQDMKRAVESIYGIPSIVLPHPVG